MKLAELGRRGVGLLLAGTLIATLAGCQTSSGSEATGPGEKPTPVNLYYTAALTQFSIPAIAEAFDLWPDDIDVTVDGGDSSVGMTLAASGRAQIYVNSAPIPEQLASGGAPLQWAATWAENVDYVFIARNGVKSLEDMRGRTLGIVQPGLTLTVLADDALRSGGLNTSDYTSRSLGTVPALVGAYQSGAVDAMVIDRTTAEIISAQIPDQVQLYDFYDNDYPWNGAGVAVNTDWADDNHDAVVSVLVGLQRAITLLREDPEKVKPVIAEFTGRTNPAELDIAVSNFLEHSLPTMKQTTREQQLNTFRVIRQDGKDWATEEFATKVIGDPTYIEEALKRLK